MLSEKKIDMSRSTKTRSCFRLTSCQSSSSYTVLIINYHFLWTIWRLFCEEVQYQDTAFIIHRNPIELRENDCTFRPAGWSLCKEWQLLLCLIWRRTFTRPRKVNKVLFLLSAPSNSLCFYNSFLCQRQNRVIPLLSVSCSITMVELSPSQVVN